MLAFRIRLNKWLIVIRPVILIKDVDLRHARTKDTGFNLLLPSFRIIRYEFRIDQAIFILLLR